MKCQHQFNSISWYFTNCTHQPLTSTFCKIKRCDQIFVKDNLIRVLTWHSLQFDQICSYLQFQYSRIKRSFKNLWLTLFNDSLAHSLAIISWTKSEKDKKSLIISNKWTCPRILLDCLCFYNNRMLSFSGPTGQPGTMAGTDFISHTCITQFIW